MKVRLSIDYVCTDRGIQGHFQNKIKLRYIWVQYVFRSNIILKLSNYLYTFFWKKKLGEWWIRIGKLSTNALVFLLCFLKIIWFIFLKVQMINFIQDFVEDSITFNYHLSRRVLGLELVILNRLSLITQRINLTKLSSTLARDNS
jgi:hypothetical protein